MKKVFISFAIATVAVAFASCGNKTAANAEGQDSAAVVEEQAEPAEQQAEENVIEDIHHLFTAVVPEGWTGETTKYGACDVNLVKKNDDGKILVRAAVNLNATNEFAANHLRYGIKEENKVGEEQIGNYTWTLYQKDNFFAAFAVNPAGSEAKYIRVDGTVGVSEGASIDDIKVALKGIKALK